jgi:hypothetical protein
VWRSLGGEIFYMPAMPVGRVWCAKCVFVCARASMLAESQDSACRHESNGISSHHPIQGACSSPQIRPNSDLSCCCPPLWLMASDSRAEMCACVLEHGCSQSRKTRHAAMNMTAYSHAPLPEGPVPCLKHAHTPKSHPTSPPSGAWQATAGLRCAREDSVN